MDLGWSKLNFEAAKLFSTLGFKKFGAALWNAAEKDEKEQKYGASSIEKIFLNSSGVFSNNLMPKIEILNSLAEEQIYLRSKNFFDVFGFVILRNFICYDEIKKINETLLDMPRSSSTSKAVFIGPVENSRRIQEILIRGPLFEVASKILGPFWYYGSDAVVETGPFALHRDTFFSPPLYKVFIPTKPAIFQVLCGSHHTGDEFSRSCGQYVCDWDKASSSVHGNSSIYFEYFRNGRNVVGYDDSHKNPPLTNISLNLGDVFIFNQNLIHGLLPVAETTSFIAITAFPSPENSKKFNISRQEHLESIIRSVVSVMLVDKELSASRKVNSKSVMLPGRAFAEKDLEEFINDPKLREYFGLTKIPLSKWEAEIKNNSHASWEILRDLL